MNTRTIMWPCRARPLAYTHVPDDDDHDDSHAAATVHHVNTKQSNNNNANQTTTTTIKLQHVHCYIHPQKRLDEGLQGHEACQQAAKDLDLPLVQVLRVVYSRTAAIKRHGRRMGTVAPSERRRVQQPRTSQWGDVAHRSRLLAVRKALQTTAAEDVVRWIFCLIFGLFVHFFSFCFYFSYSPCLPFFSSLFHILGGICTSISYTNMHTGACLYIVPASPPGPPPVQDDPTASMPGIAAARISSRAYGHVRRLQHGKQVCIRDAGTCLLCVVMPSENSTVKHLTLPLCVCMYENVDLNARTCHMHTTCTKVMRDRPKP